MRKASEAEEALPRLEADHRVSLDSHLERLPYPHPQPPSSNSSNTEWQIQVNKQEVGKAGRSSISGPSLCGLISSHLNDLE